MQIRDYLYHNRKWPGDFSQPMAALGNNNWCSVPVTSYYLWYVSAPCSWFVPHSLYEMYPCCDCSSISFSLIAEAYSTLWRSHYAFIGFWLVGMWVPSSIWCYECSCMCQAGNICAHFLYYRFKSRLHDMGKCYTSFLEDTAKQLSKAVVPYCTLKAMTTGHFLLSFLPWL